MPPSVVLRFEVLDIDPCIWRVVRVRSDLRLSDLHHVLQLVLGWTDRGGHSFAIQNRTPVTARRHSAPCCAAATVIDEGTTIAQALACAHDSFLYVYDDVGKWRVRVSRAPGVWRGQTKSPIVCLDGYLAGPPDVGTGPEDYSAVLAATLGRGPKLTPVQRERLGPDFDPERFDRTGINRALAALAL